MDTDEFQMGFFRKSEKLWINNDRDVSDALDLMRVGKLTLWCMGKSKQPKHGKRNRDKSGDAEDEAEFTSGRSKKKKSSSAVCSNEPHLSMSILHTDGRE